MTINNESSPSRELPVTAKGSFLRMVPEGMIAHWRFGEVAPDLPSFQTPLKEVRLTLDEAQTSLTGFDLTFVCTPEIYREIESWSWFGLDGRQAELLRVTFAPDIPITVEVSLDPDWVESLLSSPPDPDDPQGTLERLLEPLLNPKLEGSIHQPGAYIWKKVIQEGPDGMRGFTPTGVIMDVNAVMGVTGGAEPDSPQVTIRNLQLESKQVFSIDPGVPISLFQDPMPPLEPILEQVRYLGTNDGTPRIEATIQVLFEDYQELLANESFGLTPASRGPNTLAEFDEELPVHVDMVLNDETRKELMTGGELSPQDLLRMIVETLSSEDSDSPLLTMAAWTWKSILQQPEGHTFKVGYENVQLVGA